MQDSKTYRRRCKNGRRAFKAGTPSPLTQSWIPNENDAKNEIANLLANLEEPSPKEKARRELANLVAQLKAPSPDSSEESSEDLDYSTNAAPPPRLVRKAHIKIDFGSNAMKCKTPSPKSSRGRHE